MKLKNLTILIISNEPWGKVWYSKHHYANELSISNHVFFLDPPSYWRFTNLLKPKFKTTVLKKNLILIKPHNYLPLTGKSKYLERINSRFVVTTLKKIIKKINTKELIVWTFDPYRIFNPKLLAPKLVIYHSVDYYTHPREKWLFNNVDIILATSDRIAAKYRSLQIPVYQIPHGVNSPSIPFDHVMRIRHRKEIILVGTITARIDFELLYKISSSFQDYNLKIVGPIDKRKFNKNDWWFFNKLEQQENVIFTGAIKYHELEKHILSAAIGLCILKADYIGNQLSSHKILQYLIYGKNVVTTQLEEYQHLVENEILYMGNSHEDIIMFCEKALKNKDDVQLAKKRILFAKARMYSRIIESIESYLPTHINDR
ncbi:MAG: hypothetical protein COA57_00990 [Flavobacteriales bacterium]|nr:MAG: hypothetical protein COA57_00990 [Flavobacteriales bacterium]